jgi:Holliday junction resolvase RusA-like endonuclease
MIDEPLEIEDRGYQQGINPLFGRFFLKFDIAPVPYASPNRHKFHSKVKSAFEKNKYVFSGEVKVNYTLYQEEQTRLETSDFADLDNYLKLLNDCIKGHGGMIIDDCQIQSISISWIDTGLPPYFELEIQGHPDEFVLKPFALYEMADHLYYPISEFSWTKDGVIKKDSQVTRIILDRLFEMTKISRLERHIFRQDGADKFEAFYKSRGFSPILMGYHRSHIVNSGFTLISRSEWKKLNYSICQKFFPLIPSPPSGGRGLG